MKNKGMWLLILLLMLAIALMFMPRETGAADGYPKGIQVFHVEDHTCVLYEDVDLECFCPCEVSLECDVSPSGENPEKSEKPRPTEKPKPTETPPDPTKTPPKKIKCNAGRGNGSEGDPDCDPGKSYKNQGGD